MKQQLILFNSLIITTMLLMLNACQESIEEINVETELKRLRTTDHLFLPQKYERVKQYSGFHRQGQNPDRMHCLYEENGWRAIIRSHNPSAAKIPMLLGRSIKVSPANMPMKK